LDGSVVALTTQVSTCKKLSVLRAGTAPRRRRHSGVCPPFGTQAFVRREVLPHAPDAWIDESPIKIGYEISLNRYFYKPQPLRTLDDIRADILTLEKETERLLGEILGTAHN
jgi:hypothetical protein